MAFRAEVEVAQYVVGESPFVEVAPPQGRIDRGGENERAGRARRALRTNGVILMVG